MSPASSAGRNRCARSRAAPVAEPAVLYVEPGPGFLAGLRAALAATAANRFALGPGDMPAELVSVSEPVIAVALPVSDTCKEVVAGIVHRTVPRESLYEVVGPWLVTRVALEQALERAGGGSPAQDPLQLFRASGLPIRVFVQP